MAGRSMRAAVFHGRGDVRIEERPVPEPGPDEVLLRVAATGICGTDAHEVQHGPSRVPIERPHSVTGHQGPMVLGHEFAGHVETVGTEVSALHPGQLVACGAGVACGGCRWCRTDRPNLCDRYHTVGFQRDGALAEWCVAPASACVAVPDGQLTPDAAALAQPMSIAVHAVRQARLAAPERAVVVGCGGVGAFLVHVASRDVEVVAVDLDPARRDVAASLGAHGTVAPDELTARPTASRPDVVFEATGSAGGLATAVELLPPGGRLVLVGIQAGGPGLDATDVTLRELEVIGTNAHVVHRDLPRALELLAARPDPWDDVAPVAIGLDQLVDEGLVPLIEGRATAIKTLVDPSSSVSRPTRMA